MNHAPVVDEVAVLEARARELFRVMAKAEVTLTEVLQALGLARQITLH